MIQIYHGRGKGKTSAAFGAALRAAGHGLPVLVVQFMKHAGAESGEVASLRHLEPPIEVLRADLPHPIARPSGAARRTMVAATRGLFREAAARIASGAYRMVVLDELGIALARGWLLRAPVEEMLDRLPAGLELVVTGRRMPRWLLDRADLVTRMVNTRHPWDRGGRARRGIEY